MKYLLAATALVLAAPAMGAELINNGSFETAPQGNTTLNGGSTAIAGWTTLGQGVEWFTPASFGSMAWDGISVVDLAWFTSNGNPGGGIAQEFATTAGTDYTLTFYGATSASDGRDGTGVIDVQLTGQAMQSFALSNASPTFQTADWQRFDLTFTATAALTRLEFRNTQNAFQHFANLDGVSVQVANAGAVPEPTTWALLLTGFGFVGGAMRRRKAVYAPA